MQLNGVREHLDSVFDALVGLNTTLGLQGWLIVLTLVLTGMSYRSQKRAGIREAIEQLDPRSFGYKVLYRGDRSHSREVQIKAGLNSFSILKRRSKISFVANRIYDSTDRVVGHSAPPPYLTLPEQQTDRVITLRERLLDHDKIDSIYRDESQIVVTASTSNPVECRQVANYVLDELDHTIDNHLIREDFRPWPDP